MTPDEDLLILDQQEKLLQFPSFDANTAWELGVRLREAALRTGIGCTIEIEIARQVVFTCATPDAQPGQANWIRRKRNTVHHFARSTYAIGRKLERDRSTLLERHALAELDFAAHGGGFPLRVVGTGMIGTVVFSGLPQRDDHNTVVDALAALLRVDAPRLV